MSHRIVQIDGVKYSRDLLGLADKFVEQYGSISKKDMVQMFCVAMDAGRLTESEEASFDYICANHRVDRDARQELKYLLAQYKESKRFDLTTLQINERLNTKKAHG